MEQELEAKSYRLQEVNSALKTLLRQRDEDRKELEEAPLTNIENLIVPYIKRLKSGPLSTAQASLLEILETHLKRTHFQIRQNACARIPGLDTHGNESGSSCKRW